MPPQHVTTTLIRIGLLLLAALLNGCAARSAALQPPADPLAGRIFDSASGQERSRDSVLEQLAGADVVYLGETHDNPRHHAIQQEIVAALLAHGRKPGIGLEMAGTEQTGYLVDYVHGQSVDPGAVEADAKRLRQRLGWDAARAVHWERYGPLVELARSARLPLFGIDLPPALRLRLQRAGHEGLLPVELAQLPATAAREPDYRALMLDRLKGAHCGYGTPQSVARLYATWVARNDAMAAAIVAGSDSAEHRPIVVIVGAGHVQHARGVQRRVAELRPALHQVNLGLHEVADQAQPLADYLAPLHFAGTDFGPLHELLWLTPRQTREDPCAVYRDLLEKRHGKPGRPEPAAAGS
jgi:uncharacterized iron-regulated protein